MSSPRHHLGVPVPIPAPIPIRNFDHVPGSDSASEGSVSPTASPTTSPKMRFLPPPAATFPKSASWNLEDAIRWKTLEPSRWNTSYIAPTLERHRGVEMPFGPQPFRELLGTCKGYAAAMRNSPAMKTQVKAAFPPALHLDD